VGKQYQYLLTERGKDNAMAFYKRANSYSRSFRAHEAESAGKRPRSRICEVLGVNLNDTQLSALKSAGLIRDEWHHVGKYANEIAYIEFFCSPKKTLNFLKQKKLITRKKLSTAYDFLAPRASQRRAEKLRLRKLAQLNDDIREIRAIKAQNRSILMRLLPSKFSSPPSTITTKKLNTYISSLYKKIASNCGYEVRKGEFERIARFYEKFFGFLPKRKRVFLLEHKTPSTGAERK